MKEYGIKIGRCIVAPFKSLACARKRKRDMEQADRAYDIPNPPRRSIVFREVGSWENVEESETK